jgi:hypothetical protein
VSRCRDKMPKGNQSMNRRSSCHWGEWPKGPEPARLEVHMPAYVFIILAETPLIPNRAIAPRAGCQTGIARREPPQPSMGPLIARAAGLPRQIIARPAIARPGQRDIARRAGWTQEPRARRAGRSQEARAAPGPQASRSGGSARSTACSPDGLLDT